MKCLLLDASPPTPSFLLLLLNESPLERSLCAQVFSVSQRRGIYRTNMCGTKAEAIAAKDCPTDLWLFEEWG